ncbi:MAG: DUF1697 domain-containing protein [Bacteroidota bacterium]
MNRYVAFLRGINVSGHHKLPMAELRQMMLNLEFEEVVTILNSGNIVFSSYSNDIQHIADTIAKNLEQSYGFTVPTVVKKGDFIQQLLILDPFKGVEITKKVRLYVSFLMDDPKADLSLPWASEDGSYKILTIIENTVISMLDLEATGTPKAMEALEKFYGKEITTRNWNTINRLAQKL